ncbi:MAG: hypothetical protein GJ679_00015 [Rhodobacteraceae bacterium]|nr:hypothetical protein [Paracoccaceae bacterium]
MKEHFGPPVFLDWFFLHQEEYSALEDAKEGRPEALAQFVFEARPLQTHEAREWIKAKISNRPTETTRRSSEQDAMYLVYYRRVRRLTEQLGISEYKARQMILDDDPDLNEETLKTYIKKGKKIISEIREHIEKRRNPLG